jgi:phage tail sheath protein FI
MPASLTYPGVYIEELPSGVRTIVGVSTSLTAFVGRARKGPDNEPVPVHNFGDYDRIFGGLWEPSRMSFAVQQYFQNGGGEAIVVRVTGPNAAAATFTLPGGLVLAASSPGSWADDLTVAVNHDVNPDAPDPTVLFNVEVTRTVQGATVPVETLRNLSVEPASPEFVTGTLEQRSEFLEVSGNVPAARPGIGNATVAPGNDGDPIRDVDIVPASRDTKQGIYALEDADIFNILCLPPPNTGDDVDAPTWASAAAYCSERRAMLLVDPPSSSTNPPNAIRDRNALNLGSDKKNAALYFPRLRMANPLKNNLIEEYVPCGAVAGIYARTDSQRGVWKAPAGLEAGLSGVSELTYKLTDDENGTLNPLGINCLRVFPLIGAVVWGARTVDGADALASEWKYVPIRRLALFIEESLFRGTKWVVFEPNDEPLWAQIRLNVGAFMHQLFRQGAFQGATPREAYFVKCDAETTTQTDRNLGIVNILVGFAPLKPAEFVVIKIQQIAGEIET